MTVTLLIHDSLDCCDGGAITVSKADTADSLKDDNDAFTSLIDEVKSEFIGTYVPTADRHQGAVVYKKKVTDEDGTLLWLYKNMDMASVTASNVPGIGIDITLTWVIAYDKPNPGTLTFLSTSAANCPVNQTIMRKTPIGPKIPLEYLSIKCT